MPRGIYWHRRTYEIDPRSCGDIAILVGRDAGSNTFAREHQVLIPVKDLELAASDGTLRCVQSDGSVCTTAELDIIKEIGSSQQLTIKYANARK
jgi:hypothetical protein